MATKPKPKPAGKIPTPPAGRPLKNLPKKQIKLAKPRPLPDRIIGSALMAVFGDKKRSTKSTPKPKPTGSLKKVTTTPLPKRSSGVPTPKAKKQTLDDFLTKGKKPPMKIKPGLKRPSDADVIIKGYNDPATIKKYKKK